MGPRPDQCQSLRQAGVQIELPGKLSGTQLQRRNLSEPLGVNHGTVGENKGQKPGTDLLDNYVDTLYCE